MASSANGIRPSSGLSPLELAAMLRKSAEIVERKEFHPLLYQTMRALTAYAGEYADGGIPTKTAAPASAQQSIHSRKISDDPPGKKTSAFHDVPDSVLDGSAGRPAQASGAAAAAGRIGVPGGQLSSAASLASGKEAGHKGGKFGLKAIKKGIEKIGADILGDHNQGRDLRDGKEDPDECAWCDDCFTRGCSCKLRKSGTDINQQHVRRSESMDSLQPQQQEQAASSSNQTSINVPSDSDRPTKPCFQRPINPSSNLIANGWIDQQRRSKMRVVWKDVLASLVEGRRPGEETTLWIQRQVVNPQTGKVTGLEALHQIPMKWLEDVNYVNMYGDHRFTLKVYNIAEEFYFRTLDEQSAQSWVLTLRSARDASLENSIRMTGVSGTMAQGGGPSAKDMGLHNLDDWDSGKQQQLPPKQHQVQQHRQQQHPQLQHPQQQGGSSNVPVNSSSVPQDSNDRNENMPSPGQSQPGHIRMTIKELRAIAHGEGYDTRGMERKDLERIAAIVHNKSDPTPPPPAPSADVLKQSTSKKEETSKSVENEGSAQENMRWLVEEAEKRKAAELHAAMMRAAAEKREKEEAMAKAQEDARKREMEEKIAFEHIKRQREAEQAAELKRRQEEENLKRVAEQAAAQEARRRKESEELAEKLRRQKESEQAAELKRKQEEENMRRAAEQAAAERKRREEQEQWRRQQQQQQQAQHQQQQQQQQQTHQHQYYSTNQSPPNSGGYAQGNFQQPWAQQQQHQQYQQWQQQQQQQQHSHFQQQSYAGHQQPQQPQTQTNQHFFQNTPQNAGGYYQQQQQHSQPQQQPASGGGQDTSGFSAKYAKQMEEQSEEELSASTLQIKRSILINWALQPPNLNVLRPIDQLVTTIHMAMPPAFGVAAHDYFAKFTPINRDELVMGAAMGGSPDENKLKKAVRKVRVFLHPDKLPRDLSSEQHFMARMLWDITSDSWEEFLKHKEELDWIRS